MDTLGRTTLILTARNIVDELRDREIIVTYDYTFMAGMRKPLSLAGLVNALFGAAYILGSLDTKIVGKARS
jgi:oligosaccharyltransferase complex subunit alpha (ribophorin I)